MTRFQPTYLNLLHSGELKERVKEAYQRLEACDVCPRECGVNRRESAKRAVRTGHPHGGHLPDQGQKNGESQEQPGFPHDGPSRAIHLQLSGLPKL